MCIRDRAKPKARASAAKAKPKARASAAKAAGRKRRSTRRQAARSVDRTRELSEEVLKSLESGQRAAIDAVRKFVDTVEEALPARGRGPSRRQDVIDAAMEMADRLVQTQYEFLHRVTDNAGKALGGQSEKK